MRSARRRCPPPPVGLDRGRYPWLQEDYDAGRLHPGRLHARCCRDFVPARLPRGQRAGCRWSRRCTWRPSATAARQVAETAWLHEMHAEHGIPERRGGLGRLRCGPTPTSGCAEQAALPAGARHPQQAGAPPRRRTQSCAANPARMQDDALAARLVAAAPTRPVAGTCASRPGIWPRRPRSRPCSRRCLSCSSTPASPGTAAKRAWRRWRARHGGAGAPTATCTSSCRSSACATAPWDWQDNARIVRDTVAIFGWQRCMFASNFPVAGLRIGYPSWSKGVMRMLDDLGPGAATRVMRDNALRFYRITPPRGGSDRNPLPRNAAR